MPPTRLLLLCLPMLSLGAAELAPIELPAARVTLGTATRYIALPGSLHANRQTHLCARVSGQVARIEADLGDTVKEGQLLALVEVPDLLADLKKLEVEEKVARQTADRMAKAAASSPDLVLPLAVEEARGRQETAAASVERVRTLLDFARITAPYAGVITRRLADPGAQVGAGGDPLFTLVDASVVRATVAAPEPEVRLLRIGLPVKVLPEALPGRVWEGTVTRLGGALEEATRTLPVEIDLPNPEGALRPGMYASVRIGVESRENARLVPVAALVMEKNNAFLFSAVDGKARKRPVKIGFNDGVRVEILEGAAEGELVLIPGRAPLADGQPVRVQEAR